MSALASELRMMAEGQGFNMRARLLEAADMIDDLLRRCPPDVHRITLPAYEQAWPIARRLRVQADIYDPKRLTGGCNAFTYVGLARLMREAADALDVAHSAAPGGVTLNSPPKSGGDSVSVPREVLDFFNFASTVFVPFTSQQQEMMASLRAARVAMGMPEYRFGEVPKSPPKPNSSEE